MKNRVQPLEATAARKGGARPCRPVEAGPAWVLLVTGMSGAGKTTALKALEDMGYEAVDNLPLSLLASVARPDKDRERPLAIGVDIRTRDYEVGPLLDELGALTSDPALEVRMLFLDCDDEVLRRRFTETRRRHPLAGDRPVSDGIVLERRQLADLRERADAVAETTDLTAADLGRWLADHFGSDRRPGLEIFVSSFAYGRGLPRDADLVFDARFLRNPHYAEELREASGKDRAVADFIAADPDFEVFFDGLASMLGSLLPRFEREGKSYLTVAIGCTGGRHRSVFVAERLAAWLIGQGRSVHLRHRDLGRDPGARLTG